jgi:hypothetical protein
MQELTNLIHFLRETLPEYEVSRNGSILIVRNGKLRMVHDFDILECMYLKGELTKENLNEILK